MAVGIHYELEQILFAELHNEDWNQSRRRLILSRLLSRSAVVT